MPIARFIVTAQDDNNGRLWSRLSTNACVARVRKRLELLELLPLVAELWAESDPERVCGGNAVVLVWNPEVTISDLVGRLERV